MTSDAYDDRFTTRAADERRHYSSFVFIVRITAVLSRGSTKVIRERDRLHMPLRRAGRADGTVPSEYRVKECFAYQRNVACVNCWGYKRFPISSTLRG